MLAIRAIKILLRIATLMHSSSFASSPSSTPQTNSLMSPNHPASLSYPYTITKKQVITNRWLDLEPNRCWSSPIPAIQHQSPSVNYRNTKSQDNSSQSPSYQGRRRPREEDSFNHQHQQQHPMADECTCCAERLREHKRPRRVVITKTEIDKSITFTSPTTYSTTTTVSTTTLTATVIPVLRPLQQPQQQLQHAQQQWRFQPDYPPERRENR